MIRRIMLAIGLVALAASPALSATGVVSKTGEVIELQPGAANVPSQVQSDFEWNSAGAIDFVPTVGGSAAGWAEWFITAVQNTTGQDLLLEELGFPCDGPPTGTYGWMVWVSTPVPPNLPGDASSAQFYGSFTPASNAGVTTPTTYTYVPVSVQGIVVPDGDWLWFGYDNTAYGGMTAFNGTNTWGWYGGAWDPDANYSRTAVLQVKAQFFGPTPTRNSSWGAIKRLYH
jgi:hypothetical protein